MDAYTNCRQFNCITPIVEQTEYHMFCREKPELYMPELYHKIGVGKCSAMVTSILSQHESLAVTRFTICQNVFCNINHNIISPSKVIKLCFTLVANISR